MRARTRWVLFVLAIGMLAAGYVWLSQVTATTEAGRSDGLPLVAASGASTQPVVAQAGSVPAPGPGQKKAVLEQLGMV